MIKKLSTIELALGYREIEKNDYSDVNEKDLKSRLRDDMPDIYGKDVLQLKPTKKKGFGIFAKYDIPPGVTLIEYVGVVRKLSPDDNKSCYMMHLSGDYHVDAEKNGNISRFFNHGCVPNCSVQTLYDKKGLPRLFIHVKSKKIKAGTELTYDYKYEIDSSDINLLCQCEQESCRKMFGKRPKDFEPNKKIKKVYQCTYCAMKFSKKSTLDRHLTIHTGIKSFACEICDKVFGRKDVLQKHEETHLPESERTWHPCDITGCNSRFSSAQILRYHKCKNH